MQPFGRGGISDLRAVLSSGVAGAGVPGVGGWSSSWAYGPSIIPLSTSVQIAVGTITLYWLFMPAAFFSGLAVWPSSFREFDAHGRYYNETEGHYAAAHGSDPIKVGGGAAVGRVQWWGARVGGV